MTWAGSSRHTKRLPLLNHFSINWHRENAYKTKNTTTLHNNHIYRSINALPISIIIYNLHCLVRSRIHQSLQTFKRFLLRLAWWWLFRCSCLMHQNNFFFVYLWRFQNNRAQKQWKTYWMGKIGKRFKSRSIITPNFHWMNSTQKRNTTTRHTNTQTNSRAHIYPTYNTHRQLTFEQGVRCMYEYGNMRNISEKACYVNTAYIAHYDSGLSFALQRFFPLEFNVFLYFVCFHSCDGVVFSRIVYGLLCARKSFSSLYAGCLLQTTNVIECEPCVVSILYMPYWPKIRSEMAHKKLYLEFYVQ